MFNAPALQVADSLVLKNLKLKELVQQEDYNAVHSLACFQDDQTLSTTCNVLSAVQAIPQPDMLLAGCAAAR